MSGSLERHAWPRTACRTAAGLTVACGVALLGYVRPGFDRLRPGTDPTRLDAHLALTTALDVVHVVAGVACLALAAWPAVQGSWAGARWRRHVAVATLAVGVALVLATGLVVPWRELLPWSEGMGRNRARPALVLEAEGPFSELIDVRASYEPERRSVPGGSVTGAGIATLVALHALALPVTVWGLRRARAARQAPARTGR